MAARPKGICSLVNKLSYFFYLTFFSFPFPFRILYLHCYFRFIDGEYKFGIEAEGLHKESSNIPNEPSYLILNTAISTTWGFPEAPKDCHDYDCKVDEKRCGFPEGFCEMLPAHYLIDHVRVYQNKYDKSMTVGCNPREFPTKRFIQAHEYRYMKLTDKVSLQPLVTGGEDCKSDGYCGEGVCREFKCQCRPGWMGPRCLVIKRSAFSLLWFIANILQVAKHKNDFEDWDVDHWQALYSPYIPSNLGIGVAVIAVGLSYLVGLVYTRRKNKLNF